jgi:flagellar biosynthesis protein FliR
MINGWDTSFVYAAFLVVLRLGALVYLLPIFENRSVPNMVRIAFILLLSNIVVLALPDRPLLPVGGWQLLSAAISELGVGLFMGLAVRIAFQTVALAGELFAINGGFMRDSVFDPMSQHPASAVERLLSAFAVTLFLAMGMHLQVLGAFVESFSIAPLGQWIPSAGAITGMIYATSQIFVVAVQMAAPLLALTFVINMTFAVLGKAAPQMNVFIVSFAIIILASLFVIAMTLDVSAHYIGQLFKTSADNMLYLLRL